MFAIYCEGHGSRVILSNRHITHLDNTDHGIEMHWQCTCGTEGVEVLGQHARPRVA